MSKQSQLLLKIACGAFGVVLLLQLSGIVMRLRPIDRLSIPELPRLPASLDAAAAAKSTNSTPVATAVKSGTNSSSLAGPATTDTNSAPSGVAKIAPTNSTRAGTPDSGGTNSSSQVAKGSTTNSTAVQTSERKGTNIVADHGTARKGTNLTTTSMAAPGAATKLADIPPLFQARIDRVYQSEILGTVMRPLPMGLLGIAGNVAFLRAANGQTGMVKEGDELGGIKLLRIGVNRVLIEHEGQTKELTIFTGFGSESLLPKQKETPNETVTKSR